MKAVVCRAFGPIQGLRVEESAEPVPAAGQVIVDVHACGVNFPDVLIVQGKYQEKPDLPFSPGGEVAGIVSAVGGGVSDELVGRRVVSILRWGGFVERLAVPVTTAHPVPNGMDLITASVLGSAYGTALHALKDRAALRAGETLVVLGASGGLGLAAVELGKALGAEVIAAASSPEKLATCKRHGADELIDYTATDLGAALKSLTTARGADVVFDPVGGAYSEDALRSLGWDGRFLVVGFAAGEIPRIPLNLALLKGCKIIGVHWGAAIARDPAALSNSLNELGSMWADGRIRPYVSAVFPFDQVRDALEMVAARRAQGKLVIVTDASERWSASR